MSLRVIYDTKTDTSPTIRRTRPKLRPPRNSTRAVTETDDYLVRIVNTDDQKSHFRTAPMRSLQAELAAGLQGVALVLHHSDLSAPHRTEEIQAAAWNAPGLRHDLHLSIT